MMRLRRPSKAQRRRALAAILDGLPPVPELPPEIDEVVIREDGRLLTGGEWVTPSDYQDADDQAGLLPAWKGMTDTELQSLGEPTDDQATNT